MNIQKVISIVIYNIYNVINNSFISKTSTIISDKYNKLEKRENSLKEYKKKLPRKFYTKQIVTKDDLIKYIDEESINHVYSWAYTGGSYGQPLRVPYSKKRALIRTATFKFFNELGGYKLGDSFALIRAKNKSALEKFLRNETILIPQDVSEAKIIRFIELLSKRRIKCLLGYPTVMYEIAIILQKYPQYKSKLSVKYLISTSEMLSNDKRKVVKETFNANFVDRYANEEVGLIAQQESFDGDYIVNPYNVLVEVVDPDSLEPVREGETGKVLVTDIANDLVPMYRYDTGDLAIAGKYFEGELRTLKKIIGRESEKIYDTHGNPVSSLTLGPGIYKPLSIMPDLYQFQFAQTSPKNYELRLKTTIKVLPSALCETILLNLNERLGKDAHIKILKVDDIPPQPSGKRPVYKNETIGCK
jgi:phenylacetate-CoA ligase